MVHSSRGNFCVTCEKWRLVRNNMNDDVGLTTMNIHSLSFSLLYSQLGWKGATGRKMENDFSSTGPGYGKICRGFSRAGVKSYDNRSVKRVRGYFIITDCTQTSVHYAHPLSLSFSLSLSFPSSLFLLLLPVDAYIRITELRAKACW